MISRIDLLNKLLKQGMNGNILNVIMNIYSSAKSCIKNNREFSEIFSCEMGLRQSVNLSPLLFSLFVNDFDDYISNYYKGLHVANIYNDDIVFMKLFSLLYADDTII